MIEVTFPAGSPQRTPTLDDLNPVYSDGPPLLDHRLAHHGPDVDQGLVDHDQTMIMETMINNGRVSPWASNGTPTAWEPFNPWSHAEIRGGAMINNCETHDQHRVDHDQERPMIDNSSTISDDQAGSGTMIDNGRQSRPPDESSLWCW